MYIRTLNICICVRSRYIHSSPKEISPPPSPIGLNLSWQEAELAATYNASPDSLLEIAITVSETEASMNQSIQEVVFETNRRGNYWIISQESDNYLIPKQHIKLNQFNKQMFTRLFESSSFQEDSSKLLLLKPAKVSPINLGKSWQLSEPGIVKWIQIKMSSSDTPTPTPECVDI